MAEQHLETAAGDRLMGLPRNLALRVISSVVILPPAIGLLFVGGHAFSALLALISAGMAWEWARMVSNGGGRATAGIAAGVCALVVLTVLEVAPDRQVPVMVGAVAAVVLSLLVTGERNRLWVLTGCVIACLAGVAAVWLRATDPDGLTLTAWLIAAVVATDVGGYAAGRTIGGPKLAPRVSPNKTWAGLIGGMVASAAVSVAVARIHGDLDALTLGMLGAGITVVAQAGDLCESALKRRFEVKDSGALIPGHGGVMDRVDGHVTVMMVAALGVMISGRSPLLW